MKMNGYVKPSRGEFVSQFRHLKCRQAEIRPTRQVALLVEAQVRNVSAESKVSAPYPYADSKLAIAARIFWIVIDDRYNYDCPA